MKENENIIFTGPSGEPWLVVEFMCFGDLAEILRTNSGVLSLQRSDSPVLEMVFLSFLWIMDTSYIEYNGTMDKITNLTNLF